jgi:hypothetical protein
MKSLKVWMPAVAALAFAFAAWPTPPAKATAQEPRETDQQLVSASFMREGNDFDRYRLSDRDVIRITEYAGALARPSNPRGGVRITSDVPNDKVEIVLVSGQNVTWWKGITAFKNAPLRRPGSPRENWVRLAHVDTQDDDHGPDKMLLNVADLRDGLKLSFEKAKAFGAHTPMYTFNVPNPQQLGGARITFTWERDG